MTWYKSYVKRFYASRPGWIHGTQQFHNLCSESIKPNSQILEVGAGLNNGTSQFLAERGRLDGVDIDPDVHQNDALENAWTIQGDDYPVENERYDACVSNYVLEHVADPDAHLNEIHRILKPGGCYIFRTPNLFHYVAMVSALTPHSFHKRYANRLRDLEAEAHDPYPTVYKLNTRKALHTRAINAGFKVMSLEMIESTPSYGASSRALFFAGLAYERVVMSTERLAGLRANLLGVLRKEKK
ncbi:MAG: hypothetical protein CL917_19405 [Deltaproteobacteria bacterium]|nr:hypothetical protein [Deltaproteobacteria bacterium]